MAPCNESLITLGDDAVDKESPVMGTLTYHHLGLIVTAVFGLLATIIGLLIILNHATHYSKPHEQKHIIRILAMIPIYAIVSFISYWQFRYAIYWQVIRDCYEAIAIASFFALLSHYIAPNLHDQKEWARALKPKNWVLPINWLQKCTGGQEKGIFRRPRSGLTWFNITYVGVFQYCFFRVFFTFVAMISQFFNRYCESSNNPEYAHVWVLSFEALSVTVAMYCLIQFFVQIKGEIAGHHPLLKVACIKLVIFLSFWQNLIISFLASSRGGNQAILHPTDQLAYPDIIVGIPSMLLCIEMFLFSILHIFAFPVKSEYGLDKMQDPNAKYHGGPLGIKAIFDAVFMWDLVKASARGFKWLFIGVKQRKQDRSYAEYELGRERTGDTGYETYRENVKLQNAGAWASSGGHAEYNPAMDTGIKSPVIEQHNDLTHHDHPDSDDEGAAPHNRHEYGYPGPQPPTNVGATPYPMTDLHPIGPAYPSDHSTDHHRIGEAVTTNDLTSPTMTTGGWKEEDRASLLNRAQEMGRR